MKCEEHVKKVLLQHIYIVQDTTEFETTFTLIVDTFTSYYKHVALETG